MTKSPTIIRSAIAVCLAACGYTAFAAPYGCVYGYEDNTCLQPIRAAPQVAPTCSPAPGWTTVTPAQWQGSHYSAPQCSYQAAPTCPAGYAQTSAPGWNGLTWSNPGCAAPPPPGNITVPGGGSSDPVANCTVAANANGLTIVQGFGRYAIGNTVDNRFGGNGPVAANQCGDTTTWYQIDCITGADNQVQSIYGQPALPGCAGGGG